MFWVRFLSAASGLLLAVFGLLVWRVPDGWGDLGARFTLTANRSGPLGVSPIGPVLTAVDLQPGSEGISTHLDVRNQTSRALDIRLRVVAATPDLDALLHIEIRSETLILFDGPLRGLHNWTFPFLNVKSARSATVVVRAWLPRGAYTGYQGRVVSGRLELATQPASS